MKTPSIDSIVSLIAPHECIMCGEVGSTLCGSCLLVAGEPPAPRCAGCRALSKDSKTCRSCRSWLDIYSVDVANTYSGAYERLVYALKFDLQRDAAIAIASMMSDVAPDIPDCIVCPVPTAPSRIRARGFDHGLLIAKHVTKNIHKDEWKLHSVLRRTSNVRQLGSSRAQRMKQMKQEFYVPDKADTTGKTVLLLDDVMTTGATLAAAARTLKSAGAKRVYAVVFAQK